MGEVSGVVSDSSGPAAAARIVLISGAGRNPMFGVSAADGTYKFGAVPPGNYKLVAGDADIITLFQQGKDTAEYADIAESLQVFAGDKATKALKKIVPGGR
jgi:hypothetical protein